MTFWQVFSLVTGAMYIFSVGYLLGFFARKD